MSAFFDLYKVDFRGPDIWLGSVHSYGYAALEVELSAARAPGDYAIVNRQTGERTVLSFGLSVDGRHGRVTPITANKPPQPKSEVFANEEADWS
jgi:hypothetical protein